MRNEVVLATLFVDGVVLLADHLGVSDTKRTTTPAHHPQVRVGHRGSMSPPQRPKRKRLRAECGTSAY
jgi:hypothetical protein